MISIVVELELKTMNATILICDYENYDLPSTLEEYVEMKQLLLPLRFLIYSALDFTSASWLRNLEQ